MQLDECRHPIQTALDRLAAVLLLLVLAHFLGRNMVSCTGMQRVTKPLCKHPESKAASPEAHHSIFAGKLLMLHWGQQQSPGFSYLCVAAS